MRHSNALKVNLDSIALLITQAQQEARLQAHKPATDLIPGMIEKVHSEDDLHAVDTETARMGEIFGAKRGPVDAGPR
jgi:hypothetical protein